MDIIQTAWGQVFAARDRRPIPDWAHDNVILSAPITQAGSFDASGSRHFLDIFASWQNDCRREVNILKPVRGGGSLIGDICVLWAMVNDPGPYMELFQTDKVADEHAESRLIPNFNNCQLTRDLFPHDRHKLRDNQIVFSNGHTWYVCGPSISNLQTKGLRYLRLEEVWMWAQGLDAEAVGRIGDYLRQHNSKVLRISQGGPRDGVEMEQSDWYRAYHRGVVHEWEAACLNCGQYFDPAFSGQRADGSFWGITWNHYKLPNGDWDIAKCIPGIRFECPHCKHPMLDSAKTKGEWNRTGRYRTIANGDIEIGPHKRDSFHWEAVIDYPWDELVELWLDACNAERRGDLRPKLQFYQKRRAQFRDIDSLLRGGLHFKRQPYEISADWPEEKMRFLTIDRQQEDMFWWTVRAWSTEKSRRLGFGKAYGWTALEAIREKFKVPTNRTMIDSGFQPKGDNGVYAACLNYGWIAVRGDKEYDFIHKIKRGGKFIMVRKSYAPLAYGDPDSGLGKEGRRYCQLIRFSKPQYNQKVQELVESGAWEEPTTGEDEMEKEYSAQMAGRIRRTESNPKTGEVKVYWFESKNDHARDLANMQVLGAILGDLVRDPVMENLTKSETKETEKETDL